MANKIKKPVQLPFLDFSTLAQRQTGRQDELRLNRRFVPDLYLGVLGIFKVLRQQMQVIEPLAADEI